MVATSVVLVPAVFVGAVKVVNAPVEGVKFQIGVLLILPPKITAALERIAPDK